MTKEVIVVLNEARPVYDSGSLSSSGESELDRLLEQQGIRLEPVYLPPSGEGLPNAELSSAEVELSRYYRAEVEDAASNTIIESLERLAAVESAYIKPDTENPIAPFDSAALVTSAPQLVSASAGVPSFVAQQGYLGKKPAGVGTPSAWSRPGGKGQGVTIIDIEGGWCFSHIDLLPNDGLKGGVAYPGLDWRNHGTAVFGEIAGRANAFGVTGIAPEASIGGLSHGSLGSARAIQQAIALLKAGDILLLEMHRPGPRYNFASRPDQLGYIAVEWWPDDLLAIQIASERGIIVVEAAGNGAENLDDLFYDAKGPGFPRRGSTLFGVLPILEQSSSGRAHRQSDTASIDQD